MVNTGAVTVDEVRRRVATVVDPEIPVLTIEDLGVLRSVSLDDDGTVVVAITPTYSGCPAMDLIKDQIALTLHLDGVEAYRIETVFSPAWTTDWMSEEAREKLRTVGIAPPRQAGSPEPSDQHRTLCPQCSSADTKTLSEFGSTACKALMVCEACREPFDLFKRL